MNFPIECISLSWIKNGLPVSLPRSGFSCNPGERSAFQEEQSSRLHMDYIWITYRLHMDYIILCLHLVCCLTLIKWTRKSQHPKALRMSNSYTALGPTRRGWSNFFSHMVPPSQGSPVWKAQRLSKQAMERVPASAESCPPTPTPAHSWHILRKCVHCPLYSTSQVSSELRNRITGCVMRSWPIWLWRLVRPKSVELMCEGILGGYTAVTYLGEKKSFVFSLPEAQHIMGKKSL